MKQTKVARKKISMSEVAYILVSNRIRVRTALDALREVVCLIRKEDTVFVKQVVCKLQLIEDRLFAQMEVTK